MECKTLYLKFLLWAEILVAERILLFVSPVMINNMLMGVGQHSIEDWFVASVSIPALFYLMVGIIAVLGNSMWKFLHYVVVFMTCFLSGAFLVMVVRTQYPIHIYYFLPSVVSLLMCAVVFVRGAPSMIKLS